MITATVKYTSTNKANTALKKYMSIKLELLLYSLSFIFKLKEYFDLTMIHRQIIKQVE